MSEAYAEATSGSGLKWRSNTRSISGSTVHSSWTLPDDVPTASYTISAATISVATANDHILQIMAGSSLNVRIKRIWVEQLANATTATLDSFLLLRLTTAGTGGTAVTPAKLDTADSASGATAMTLPSAKGTESTEIRRSAIVLRQAILTTATQPEESIDWRFGENGVKPLVLQAGTSNGVCLKNGSAVAAGTVIVYVELTETSYL